MSTRWQIRVCTAAAFCTLLLVNALPAHAQGTSAAAIAGAVKDSSGAVMPGVTVEASSPALIEQAGTAVTDAQGQYQIIELRPGAYTVRFSLQGFATLTKAGVELT